MGSINIRLKPAPIDFGSGTKSVASAIEPIFKSMDKLSFKELKEAFQAVIDDEAVSASEATRKKWRGIIATSGHNNLMIAMSNLYLKAKGLSLNQ